MLNNMFEIGDDVYHEQLIDHYQQPRNKERLTVCDVSLDDTNPLCGDRISVFVKFDAEGGRIERMTFEGHGCAISQAAASMVTEEVQGKAVADVLALDSSFIVDLLGIDIGPARMKCAMLGLRTVQKALVSRH
jgi:nitrogen fixation protein NifU and related proteins